MKCLFMRIFSIVGVMLFSAFVAVGMGRNAYAGSVTITNTFTSGDPAVASEVNQNFTDVKNAVDDNDSRITTIETTIQSNLAIISETSFGSSEVFTGTSSFEELKVVTTYTKLSSSSAILITYNDSLQSDGSACTIQVRVDGAAPDGGAWAAPIYTTYSTQNFFSTTGIFTGISTGLHSIALYKRVLGGATCTRDNGNWSPTMIIMEIEP